MNTRIIKITPHGNGELTSSEKALIKEAGDIIKNGGLVAFPTETVYGLGGDAFNASSSQKIYAAKGRPSDNPLIVHIADTASLDKAAVDIPDEAYILSERFMPGPLTLILKKISSLPDTTTGGLSTVALRMPSDRIANEFIKAAGGFVAAPSANISGRPSPTSVKYVTEDLNGRVDMIIDGGSSLIGLESTIVDLTGSIPMILRPGAVTHEELQEAIGEVLIDRTVLSDKSNEAPKAPGMKYRHYAPKGELTVVYGTEDSAVDYINKSISECKKENADKITAVIASDETKSFYKADIVKSLGSRLNERDIAHNLYRVLREMDDEGAEVIYAEGFEDKGISQATMNRLLKAAGHKEVRL